MDLLLCVQICLLLLCVLLIVFFTPKPKRAKLVNKPGKFSAGDSISKDGEEGSNGTVERKPDPIETVDHRGGSDHANKKILNNRSITEDY